MSTFGNRVDTTVQTSYLPYVVDTVLNSNVLFQRTVRAAKAEKWSGRKKIVPIKISKNSTGQSFAGFDAFSTSATDNRVNMEFNPKFYQITCALPGDELSVADTDEKVLDLMKLTIQSDSEDMADDLGTIMYQDGTGNSGKDPLGLKALVDDGTTVAVYGGLSRATYTTIKSTVTASGGTLTLAGMDALHAAVTSGSQKPTLWVTTETVFNLYGQLLRPQERISKDVSAMRGADLIGGTGFTGLMFNGKPVVADEKCTSGYMYALNENYINFYSCPFWNAKSIAYKNQIKGNDYESPLGLGFSWSDWIIPANQGAVIGHMYFGGEFINTNPKRSGVITGVTGI